MKENLFDYYKIWDKFISFTLCNRVGCRIKDNRLHVGPGPTEGVPSMAVFLRDPSTYLRKFRRKPQKTPNG